jgi:hypothetical protein
MQLNDAEMTIVLSLAGPIDQQRPPQFLEEIAQAIEAQRQAGEIGVGAVHRLARAIQRKYWNPPQFREGEPARRA